MRLSRRNIIQGTAALAGGAALSGAAPFARTIRAKQDGPKQIEYWHRLTGDNVAAIDTLAQQFNEEFAGQIEVTPIAQGTIQELNQKVRAAAAGGGLPAALMADDADILSYYAGDVIVPLDPYIDDPEVGLTEEDKADFLPGQLTRHKLPLYDDNTMSFPIGFSTYSFYWNVDALTKAGLEGPPKTWAELPDAMRQIAGANPGMVFNIQPDLGPVYIFALLTHGVSWLKESGEESNFDAPEALAVMQMFEELAADKLIVPDENHADQFLAGSSAFFLQSSVQARRFNNEIEGFAWDAGLPPQASPDAEPVTELFGPLSVVPQTDEETQRAGWTWIKWLTNPGPHATFASTAGYFPARYSAADEPVLSAYYEENPIHKKLFETVAPVARIPQPGPALVAVRGPITSSVLTEVVLGRLSADEAVRRLKAEADDEIQQSL